MEPGTHEHRVSALRRANTARCALQLRDQGPAAVSELARATGLSRPTVEAALADLAARGLVANDEMNGHRGAGRPARVSRFVGSAGYVAGVDVGIAGMRVILADLAGTVAARVEHQGPVPNDGSARIEAVRLLVAEALRLADAPAHRLVFAHIGVTGLVRADGRIWISHGFADWEGVDVGGKLAALLGCPVTLDNDVNLAALAEQRLGSARLADDMIFLLIGSQISAGLVLDGRLRRGSHNAAGELGDASLRVPLDERGHIVWRSASTARGVFELADAGDAEAMAEVDAFIAGIADTVVVLAQTIDPDLVVIGGPMSRAGDRLVKPLNTAVAALVSLPFAPTVLASRLGIDSIAFGALSRAFDLSSELVYGVHEVPMPALRRPDGGDALDSNGKDFEW
ncbi:putative NBD/HSP70 family sugar kinase [Agromyces cerinus]|uniref:ROK family transcriptional regulator n=1 Tax=Agromyces cerinus TaxID=33878 RepID=UPI00195B3A25|nr:ROK family transcriptional regulator [Agromyces cerinus]MBM7829554.1 putative NBD/HSP70 family sugar kinase [Agromyces cerinus]